jgi:hypothetical protein
LKIGYAKKSVALHCSSNKFVQLVFVAHNAIFGGMVCSLCMYTRIRCCVVFRSLLL